MFNRLTLTLWLDIAMLVLVCVLEAVALTGVKPPRPRFPILYNYVLWKKRVINSLAKL
jgi:hypothetical protein